MWEHLDRQSLGMETESDTQKCSEHSTPHDLKHMSHNAITGKLHIDN